MSPTGFDQKDTLSFCDLKRGLEHATFTNVKTHGRWVTIKDGIQRCNLRAELSKFRTCGLGAGEAPTAPKNALVHKNKK